MVKTAQARAGAFIIWAAITLAVICFGGSYFRVADYCWHAGQYAFGYLTAAMPDLTVVVCIVALRLGLDGGRRVAAWIWLAASFALVCRGNLGRDLIPVGNLDRTIVALWPAFAALGAFLLVELEGTRPAAAKAPRQRTPQLNPQPLPSLNPQPDGDGAGSEGDGEGPDTRAQFAALRGAVRRDAVLAYLDEHPELTQAQAADATGVPLKTIEGYVRQRRQTEEVPA